ncbi:MAG: phosphoprotein phosphatase [Myxococcales bacterium]|nr:phosphoprotein phosphatase [Myxococcales bacterium]
MSELTRAWVISENAKNRSPRTSQSVWKLPILSPSRSNHPSVRIGSRTIVRFFVIAGGPPIGSAQQPGTLAHFDRLRTTKLGHAASRVVGARRSIGLFSPLPTMDRPSPQLLAAERGVVVQSFDFRVEFAARTAAGSRNPTNQDALLCRPDLGLFAIADGMGGHAAGEVAAALALSVLEAELARDAAKRVVRRYGREPTVERRADVFALLRASVGEANRAVRRQGESSSGQRGMGTTLDAVLLARDRAFVAHVGDSRIYLLRGPQELRLTSDHRSADFSIRKSGRQVTSHHARGALSRSVGHAAELVPDTLSVDLASDDRLLLCTDGAFAPFNGSPEIWASARFGEIDVIAAGLLDAAQAIDRTDDASVLAIGVRERFVSRATDAAPRARDLAIVEACPLLSGVGTSATLATLAAALEIEVDCDEALPSELGGDRFAYIVLDGKFAVADGRTMGPSALLMAESLVDVACRDVTPRALERGRLLRIRHEDFVRAHAHDHALAAQLYQRLARHLAQTRVAH